MAKAVVEIEVLAAIDKATKAVESLARNTQKQLDSIKTDTFATKLNQSFELIKNTAGVAFNKVVQFVGEAIAASEEAEQANIKLAQSMKIVGDFSETAVRNFNDFADALSLSTGASDELIKESAALAKNFNLTNEEAKKVVKVALDLSAATGRDLNSSVTALAQSYNGLVDKSLKKMFPALDQLNAKQKASGAIVDLVGKKFEGQAEILAGGYTGSVQKAKNSYGELLESIGNLITKNQNIINSINAVAASFLYLKNLVDGNNETYNKMSDSVKIAIINFLSFHKVTQFLAAGLLLTKVSAEDAAKAIDTSMGKLKKFDAETFKETGGGDSFLIQQRIDEQNFDNKKKLQEQAAEAEKQSRKKLNDDLIAISKSANETILNDREKLDIKYFQDLKQINLGFSKGVIKTADDKARQIANIERAYKIKGFELDKKQIEDLGKLQEKTAKEVADAKAASDKNTSEILGTVSLSGSGADAAKASLLNGITLAAKAIFGPLGPIIGQIAGVLSNGPEFVKTFVTDFIDSIPLIIEAIIDSLPVLVEVLAEKLPPLFVKIAFVFVESVVKNIPKIVAGFISGLLAGAKAFVDKIISLVPGAKGVANVVGGAASGVGGFLKKLNPFAEGGRVPDLPKFAGDKFPARLDQGEQVFSRDLTSQLEGFLNNQGQQRSSQPVNIVLQVGQRQLADILVDIDRGGFRTSV